MHCVSTTHCDTFVGIACQLWLKDLASVNALCVSTTHYDTFLGIGCQVWLKDLASINALCVSTTHCDTLLGIGYQVWPKEPSECKCTLCIDDTLWYLLGDRVSISGLKNAASVNALCVSATHCDTFLGIGCQVWSEEHSECKCTIVSNIKIWKPINIKKKTRLINWEGEYPLNKQ